MDSNDELERIQSEIENRKLELALQEEDKKKSIDQISVSDIKIKLDDSKSIESQAEDVVGAMVTASAINDEKVKETLTNKKAEELVNRAEEKASKAKTQSINAETELQKAERDLYEAVLNTFGIYKHLPRGLMKTLVWIFSPLFVIISLLIGIPCGFVKIIIDNLDGIICRYDKTGDGVAMWHDANDHQVSILCRSDAESNYCGFPALQNVIDNNWHHKV